MGEVGVEGGPEGPLSRLCCRGEEGVEGVEGVEEAIGALGGARNRAQRVTPRLCRSARRMMG